MFDIIVTFKTPKFWAKLYTRGMCIGKLPITLNWRMWNLRDAHELLFPEGSKSTLFALMQVISLPFVQKGASITDIEKEQLSDVLTMFLCQAWRILEWNGKEWCQSRCCILSQFGRNASPLKRGRKKIRQQQQQQQQQDQRLRAVSGPRLPSQ